MAPLYRYIPVWRRESKAVALYRCFEVVGVGFSVQSKDYFSPGRHEDQSAQLERQFVELLFEQAPEERSGVHPSLEAAIQAFEEDFD